MNFMILYNIYTYSTSRISYIEYYKKIFKQLACIHRKPVSRFSQYTFQHWLIAHKNTYKKIATDLPDFSVHLSMVCKNIENKFGSFWKIRNIDYIPRSINQPYLKALFCKNDENEI